MGWHPAIFSTLGRTGIVHHIMGREATTNITITTAKRNPARRDVAVVLPTGMSNESKSVTRSLI